MSAGIPARSAMDNALFFAVGPRFHFQVGKSSWIRPGVSYSVALDDPMAMKGYHFLQIDVPYAF